MATSFGNVDTSKLKEQVTQKVKSSLPNVDPSQITGALNDAVSGIQQSITNMTAAARKEANALLSKGTTLLSSSISDVGASFPNAVSELFSATNPETSALSTISEAAKGPKEAIAKVESLASDAGSALANPVAFLTKPVNESIKGTDTMSVGSEIVDALKDMSNLDLEKLSKATGIDISSSSDLTNAVTQVSNELAANFSSVTDNLKQMQSKVVEPIVSGAKEFTGDLVGGISSSIKNLSSTNTGVVDAIMDATGNLSDYVYDALPTDIKNLINCRSPTYINSQANTELNGFLNSFKRIATQLSGIADSESLMTIMTNMGLDVAHDTITDAAGGTLEALFGNNTQEVINNAYIAARVICSGVREPTFYEYRNNKDLYDVLLQVAGGLGLNHLIEELKKCAGGEAELFDQRSVDVLKGLAIAAASIGNIYSFATATKTAGVSNIPNMNQNIVQLVSNASLKRADGSVDEPKQRFLKEILQSAGLGDNVSQLIEEQVLGNVSTLNGARIGAMTSTDTTAVDGAIGSELRGLVQSALISYA